MKLRPRTKFIAYRILFSIYALILAFVFYGLLDLLIHKLWLQALLLFSITFPIHAVIIIALMFVPKDIGEWWVTVFAPWMAFSIFWDQTIILKYLRSKKCKQNAAAKVAVVLGYPDWSKLDAWLTPHVTGDEVKALVGLLEAKGQDFAFYTKASRQDFDTIMTDANTREVYIVGHGRSNLFALNNDETIYYRDFKEPKYRKDYVHQLHCGTKYGKRLIDYVVPPENRSRCISYRESKRNSFIVAELKRLTKEAGQAKL